MSLVLSGALFLPLLYVPAHYGDIYGKGEKLLWYFTKVLDTFSSRI